ncbi:hypothetical protein [Agrobacterium tumefaciens]|uniref:Uncharacterized protein n=1 Tax=Agrobacterium tumefaciens TaxID=358 RepID=A0AB36EDP0_AGRTU|nr:hypothetical protein A6U91_18760 [Agrobacterium tumefaciens]
MIQDLVDNYGATLYRTDKDTHYVELDTDLSGKYPDLIRAHEYAFINDEGEIEAYVTSAKGIPANPQNYDGWWHIFGDENHYKYHYTPTDDDTLWITMTGTEEEIFEDLYTNGVEYEWDVDSPMNLFPHLKPRLFEIEQHPGKVIVHYDLTNKYDEQQAIYRLLLKVSNNVVNLGNGALQINY